MVQDINYTYGLSFNDILAYIPNLTVNNEVVTDGKILHLEIKLECKTLNLFIDTHTNEYCFTSEDQDHCDLLYEIGYEAIRQFNNFSSNLDLLIDYLKKVVMQIQ